MPVLALKGLGRTFGAYAAVNDIDLELKSGEFVSLLGPSGCGKTTTLRMIAGFVEPTSGSILLDGVTLSSPKRSVAPEHRNMSMIFQSYAIWPNLTVFDNVAFGLKLRKLPPEEVRRRVGEILEIVRLDQLAGRFPAELSGGQQQRVALARAIVVKPSVLLLDEPLSNLDASLREEMRYEIRRMHDEFRFTTVYVTHDQTEAMVTSDRIAVMNGGSIEQVDDPFTLYNRPLTRFVANFIGRTNVIAGRRTGDFVDFPGFSFPVASLAGTPDGPTPLFSVRPESLRIEASDGASAEVETVPCVVTERAYLGQVWEYLVSIGEGAPPLKVSSPPRTVFAVGDKAWLALDPSAFVGIRS